MAEISSTIMYIFLFLVLYFEVYMLLLFLERETPQKKSSREGALPTLPYFPTVAIVIPAYNEGAVVARTIHSLLALRYPKKKLSIVAVDDGSTDNTWQAMQEFSDHPQVQLIQKENGGKHTALNTALPLIKSELVGCLDSDSTVDPDALTHVVAEFLSNPEVDAVTPAMRIRDPKNLLERIQAAEYTLAIFMRRVFAYMGAQFVTPGPFSFFRREVYDRLGYYKKAHNTEDLEYALRIQAAQGHIANTPRAIVYTPGKRTLRSLMSQRVRWVYGFLKNSQDYRSLYLNRRYGDLGIFVLPNALLAIFAAIFLGALALITIIKSLVSRYTEYYYAGFDFSPGFDWFFVNTQALLFLTVIVLSLTALLMYLGAQLSREKTAPLNMASYFLFYGLLAPLWLAKALADAMLSREGLWQAERK